MTDLKKILEQTAREMRNSPTGPEEFLWEHLRSKSLDGYKFRRQHRIGKFIVDFVCIEKRLVIELDGEPHLEQVERDAERDQIIESRGYNVLRFWNDDLYENPHGVLEEIRRHLR